MASLAAPQEKERYHQNGAQSPAHISSSSDGESDESLACNDLSGDFAIVPLFSGALPYGIFKLGEGKHNFVRVKAARDDYSIPEALFAKEVWYGSVLMAEWLREFPEEVDNKNVLELSAAAALPSIVSAKLGANMVVSTDYPNDNLIENVRNQFRTNALPTYPAEGAKCAVCPYLWGDENVETVLSFINAESSSLGSKKFDIILLAEFLWWDTHSQHSNIVHSLDLLLSRQEGASVLVSWSHHNPGREDLDMEFFEKASQTGFHIEHLRRETKGYCDTGDKEMQPCYIARLTRTSE